MCAVEQNASAFLFVFNVEEHGTNEKPSLSIIATNSRFGSSVGILPCSLGTISFTSILARTHVPTIV
jgi:hypothetical protein